MLEVLAVLSSLVYYQYLWIPTLLGKRVKQTDSTTRNFNVNAKSQSRQTQFGTERKERMINILVEWTLKWKQTKNKH